MCTIEDTTPYNFDAAIIGQISNPVNDRKWIFGYRAISNQSGTSNYLFDNSATSVANYDVNWIPQLSTWYHITWVFSAGNSIVTYINGAPHFSQSVTITNFNNVANNILTRIGNGEDIDTPNKLPWVGKIDDIGIWNRTLSQTEITTLYNASPCTQIVTVYDTIKIYDTIKTYLAVTDTLIINAVLTGVQQPKNFMLAA